MTLIVAISDFDYGDVRVERDIIEGAGFRLIPLHCKSEQELISGAPEAVAIITQYARIGAEAIRGLRHLRHIARYGTGTDIVDVGAATAAGVLVTNVPADYCREEVADHVLAMLLYFSRRLGCYGVAAHQGIWRWQICAPLHRLSGQRLGIVGLGHIGRTVAERGLAVGLDVVAYDPYIDADYAGRISVRIVSFSELLATSDYVVVQAPLTDETRGLVNADTIGQMKRGAVLINTSRGPIVDADALYRALQSGHLAGAGLDDLPEEPAKLRQWEPNHPLFSLPNCLVTPHVAYYSEESIRFCRTFAAGEVVRVLQGEMPVSPVNLTELSAASDQTRREETV